MVSLEEAEYLVALARKSIRRYFEERKPADADDAPASLLKKGGAFVTLRAHPSGALRGCIGYPVAVKPLAKTVAECAVLAAVDDPRFQQLTPKELDSITLELSVLTDSVYMKASNPEAYPKAIKIGRDGLIIEAPGGHGLLLPQVPVEQGWDAREFLDNTCLKAGLSPNCWQKESTLISRFEAQVFEELSPNGKIEEKPLDGEGAKKEKRK